MHTGRTYIFLVLFFSAALLFSGCDKSEIIAKERTTILTWISNNGSGYSEVAANVFRKITNPEDGVGTPEAAQGDSLYLNVRIYKFSSSFSAATPDLIFTNIKEFIPAGVIWSSEPIKTVLGSGALMGGVEKSLPGAAPGDVVTVIMTSENAYGGDQVQQTPANTPIAWLVTVDKVIKNKK